MRTLKQLEAKHAKERKNLLLEQRLRAAAKREGLREPYLVHLHPLYGSEATLAYGNQHSHDKGAIVTPAELRTLSDAFPAIPLKFIDEGCVSIRTAAHVDALPEKDKERWKSETDIAPFYLDIDAGNPGYGKSVKISWVTMLDGIPVEINAVLSPYATHYQTSARRIDSPGSYRYENKTLTLSDGLKHLRRIDGEMDEVLAEAESRRHWSDTTHAGQWRVHWIPNREDIAATPADVARVLEGNQVGEAIVTL